MKNAQSRLEKLEREKAAQAPFKFTFGESLKRGEKPTPGSFTFVLDDPTFDRENSSTGEEA